MHLYLDVRITRWGFGKQPFEDTKLTALEALMMGKPLRKITLYEKTDIDF